MTRVFSGLILTVTAMGAWAAGAAPSQDADASLWKAFERASAAQQKKVLASAREAIEKLDDPYLRAMRALAAQGAPPAAKTTEPPKKNQRAPSGIASAGVALPFPVRVEYVFGERRVRALDERAVKAAKPVDELRALLAGYPPDVDRSLAALLRELDHDRGADDFARFLETWRNGDESFYRALDRTSGTADEVFFFDAMLGDFTDKFARSKDAQQTGAAKGLQAAHDAVHGAFLAYRQYRAMREAAALSCCLAPDAPLPSTLGRYETAPAGLYSLRDEILIALSANDDDPARALELVRSSAKPLPAPLWKEPYDALVPFHEAFRAKAAELAGTAGSTDRRLEQARKSRVETARRVAAAVREACLRAGLKPVAEAGIGR